MLFLALELVTDLIKKIFMKKSYCLFLILITAYLTAGFKCPEKQEWLESMVNSVRNSDYANFWELLYKATDRPEGRSSALFTSHALVNVLFKHPVYNDVTLFNIATTSADRRIKEDMQLLQIIESTHGDCPSYSAVPLLHKLRDSFVIQRKD